MTVIFVKSAITHYSRDFCNHLARVPGLRLVVVHPRQKSRDAEEAVHETHADAAFTRIALEEVKVPAKRVLGQVDFEIRPAYLDFPELPSVILEWSPSVAVFDHSYHSMAAYNPALCRAMETARCKKVFRSIPFMQPTYAEALRALPCLGRIELRRSRLLKAGARATGLDWLYAQSVRNPALRRQVARRRKVFCAADAHVVYHDDGIRIYGSWGVPTDRIHVVRNSPDTDKLLAARRRVSEKQPGPAAATQRILHVGRLVEWKRVDLLIRAVAALKSNGFPSVELAVVGDGPCAEALKAQAQALRVENSVRFVGSIYDPDELARCFLSASVYVLAGMGGLSINEAMCFGLPVICSRCDGTEKFLVRHGQNGFYFQEGDLEDLTEKIAFLLSDERRRKAMGECSLKIIEQEINIHVLVDNYVRVFRSLLSEPSSPGVSLPRPKGPQCG